MDRRWMVLGLVLFVACGGGTPAKRTAPVLLEFRLAETARFDGGQAAQLPAGGTVWLHPEVLLTGADVAAVSVTDTEYAGLSLQIDFTPGGARKLGDVTRANLNRQLAVVVDGKILSAPVIRAELGSSAVITGNMDKEELERIAAGINEAIAHPQDTPWYRLGTGRKEGA